MEVVLRRVSRNGKIINKLPSLKFCYPKRPRIVLHKLKKTCWSDLKSKIEKHKIKFKLTNSRILVYPRFMLSLKIESFAILLRVLDGEVLPKGFFVTF